VSLSPEVHALGGLESEYAIIPSFYAAIFVLPWLMRGSAGGSGGSSAGEDDFLVVFTFHATRPMTRRMIGSSLL